MAVGPAHRNIGTNQRTVTLHFSCTKVMFSLSDVNNRMTIFTARGMRTSDLRLTV